MTTSAVQPVQENWQGHAAMLLFSALVAGSFSLGAQIANEIAPAALNSVRFMLAAAVIGGVLYARGGPTPGWLAAPWRYLALGGIFGSYFVLMFEGLKTASPVSSSAVFTLTPAMSAVFGWLLMRQVTTPWIAAALAVGAAGALWVIFRADLAALIAFEIGRGEAIFFVGCIAHAFYTPLIRLLNRGESILTFSFGTLLGCTLCLTIYGARDIVETDWAGLRPLVWITMVYVALGASSLTTFLVQYATMRMPSSKVMAYTYLTPTWVILWEIALGQGAPPPLILAGIALTVLALLMLLRR